MFELFEHTADVGLRVRAGDLNRLFEDAAQALFSAILADPDSAKPVEEMVFNIEGTRYDDLLFDWLSELLFTFATRHVVFADFSVRVHKAGLAAIVRGEPIDPARHELGAEIKAITYHGLKVEQTADGWLAEVIVDV